MMLTVEQLAARLRKARHHVNEFLMATDEDGAAAVLGCGVRTLQGWREAGAGPRCFRTVRWYYALDELLTFMGYGKNSSQEVADARNSPQSEHGAA